MNRPPTAPPATRQAGAQPIADPAAADLLARVRRARSLSCEQMAELVGLQGANGADAVRQMERGARPVSGLVNARARAGSSSGSDGGGGTA